MRPEAATQPSRSAPIAISRRRPFRPSRTCQFLTRRQSKRPGRKTAPGSSRFRPFRLARISQPLENSLRVVLLARTTRSVSLAEAGRRLVDSAGPSMGQLGAAFAEVSAQPGETVGRLRLSAPRYAPTVPVFRQDPNLRRIKSCWRSARLLDEPPSQVRAGLPRAWYRLQWVWSPAERVGR